MEERERLENELQETGRSFLNLCQRPLADAGLTSETEMRAGRPAEEIVAFAEEGLFDLLIIGSRGHSKLGNVILGSVSQEVVRAAKCPVLVVRDDYK
jgi:nucleotide-binding universal stress UspA family protein